MVPRHIAIIMDGNGRWASEKKLPRIEGHRRGVKVLRNIVKASAKAGVICLTVYAFSTENWKRPRNEVIFLMDLFRKTLKTEAEDLNKNNVKVNIIGKRKELKDNLRHEIKNIEELTINNDGLNLNIALNYGGRAEIIDSIKKILEDIDKGMDINKLSEANFKDYLYNPQCSEVELLIRTAGEQRLSNFLLWQNAYAEFYFTDKYWPDFTKKDLQEAIHVFQNRERKFGSLIKAGD
jgi:undecaprenyl diphosphate synthase